MHLLRGTVLTGKPPGFRAIQLLLFTPCAHVHSCVLRGFVNIDASYQGNVRCSLEVHFYLLSGWPWIWEANA